MGRSAIGKVDVRADGIGLSSRAGTMLLALTADRLGLSEGLSAVLTATRERRSAHDPGRVLCDLAVMAADGGRCVSDLAVLAGQPSLFGDVASVSTARRVLLSVGERELDGIREPGRTLASALGTRGRHRIVWCSSSTRQRSMFTPTKRMRPGITRAGSGSTRCSRRAGVRFSPVFCGPATRAPTTPPTTSRCSSSRWSNSRRPRLTARSSRGLTRPARPMISRRRAGRPGSGSRWATRSTSRCARRSSAWTRRRGRRRSMLTGSRETARGSAS